ncbi:adenine phosphoribosyltransferase [Solihabitans fulvus]|uniref:Adenine phosphoribosyltransferase n=1 Tax=Solihabitans fulvus TaxID=1892852 RepID=A0A5B2WN68_9PSEU|nr:adenine phosphoribosyltransferase [Solihabitans fulvus]KAA2252845.1 adenine phosphoribosyltransferase [Solihabitans fulvus]
MRRPDAPADPVADDVLAHLRAYPDYPSPGVLFQDLSPVLARPGLLARVADAVVVRFGGAFDTVLAIEARGFVLGAAVAQATGTSLVLARKPGKLPGQVHRVRYSLEYGEAALELQRGAFGPGARVLLVDDVLATGGTLAAAGELVALEHGRTVGYAVVVAISALGGARRLAPLDSFALVTVPPQAAA